jgi:hypothetical protein
MTRKSRREIERKLEGLQDDTGGDGILVVAEGEDGQLRRVEYEPTDMGDGLDRRAGEPVSDAALEAADLVIRDPPETAAF